MIDLKNPDAEVFDFSEFKLEQMILDAKRNPKIPQANIMTLEAVLDLYKGGCIKISWIKGEPYMMLDPDSDLEEDELKEKFDLIMSGAEDGRR